MISQPKRKNSFRPFSANPMATASPKNDPTAMIRMGTRSHTPREQGHHSGPAGVTGEREGSQLDVEPVLDSVRYSVDAGAALSYYGQGKGQKQFPHGGGLERFPDGS